MVNDDDIVISGIDGRFPKSRNMDELGWNLYNKIDMSTEDDIRWSQVPSLPNRKYFIDNLEKFDATLFKVNPKLADVMDPQGRMLLEVSYSAILDAGIHPSSLRGSRTGVFTATCYQDTMSTLFTDSNPPADGYKLLGANAVFLANRVSYALDLRGPSLLVDTACSSSFSAITMAVNAIRLNQCDAALVCGANLQLSPNLSLQMMMTGILSSNGYTFSFDSRGSGYTRSDAISAIFLQKRADAKRIYAELVHTLCNNDGYKPIGIANPSGKMQSVLFSKVYEEMKIDPLEVDYVEGHVTGTVAGDPEECYAIDTTFNRKRKKPLLVGGIKSAIGHSEAASGMCSIAKVIHSFQTGTIPATVHVKNLRNDIPSLTEGRLKVCTENTPLPGPLVALNSFGYGGSNGHLLLKQWNKKKDHSRRDQIPHVVIWSGRTENAVSTVINKVKSVPMDFEFIGLLHQIQKVQIPENSYRGFGVFVDRGVDNVPICLSEKSARIEEVKRPVVWLFTGMGCQWIGMGRSLMQIQSFYESILKCHNILKMFSVDLISIITTDDKHIYDKILTSFVGITCIQVALVDVLRHLEIPVDFIIGHSNGELAAAYADGAITLEQAALNAYYKGKVSIEEETIDGLMAAVDLGYNQIKDRLPPGVFVGCRNSAVSCTISGPRKVTLEFVDQLKSENIFAKEVNTSRIAFHSKYVGDWVSKCMDYLRDVMPEQTLRSPKWISSSVPSDQWDTDSGKYCSAEYMAKNLGNPALFEEACTHLPGNAIIIEIGPHGLLQSIMRRSFPDAINVSLARRDSLNNAAVFMEALGTLFINGIDMQIDRLYSPIEFPVSRGTPMIAPLIKYEHDQNCSVPNFSVNKSDTFSRKITIDVAQEQYQYLTHHMVDDRCMMPASTYCCIVWETLATFSSARDISEFNVEFSNVLFHRPTFITPGVPIELVVLIHTSGNFEVIENRTAVVTGTIKHVPDSAPISTLSTKSTNGKSLILRREEIYKELLLRGYRYRSVFAGLYSYCADNNTATSQWQGHWDTFIDSMLHIFGMSRNTRSLNLPLSFRRIRINAVELSNWIAKLEDSEMKLFDVTYCRETNTIVAGGIELSGVGMIPAERPTPTNVEVFEEYKFVPLMDDINTYSLPDAVRICTQLAIERLLPTQLTVLEALDGENEPVIEHFCDAISSTPIVSGSFKLITDRPFQMSSVEVARPGDIDQSKKMIVVWNSQNRNISSIAERVSRNGFLIVITADQEFAKYEPPANFQLVSAVRCTDSAFLILGRDSLLSETLYAEIISINSEDRTFSWLKKVQKVHQEAGDVILLSERDKTTGLLGFFKAVRLEPSSANYKCVIIDDDDAPPFDVNHPLYSSQLKLGLTVNILRNGFWGTYRHLMLKKDEIETKSYASLCLQAKKLGKFQSIKWAPSIFTNSEENDIQVRYAGLSQRDLLLATGQLPQCTFVERSVKQMGTFGREFSGIAKNGRRVMGMTLEDGALAKQISFSPDNLIFDVPESMTLKEAASIPIAYLTTYSAFFIANEIYAGQRILIHNGCHHIGLAAIHTSLAYDLKVFTTVSSRKDKDFLLKRHPALSETNIEIVSNLSTESISFNRIKFDVILCSQPETQIEESIHCLNEGGMMIAVEPFDMSRIARVSEPLFAKGITFKSVVLEKLVKKPDIRQRLVDMIRRDLGRGIIKPLPSNVFQSFHVDIAFQAMSTEKLNEKVLISMPEWDKIDELKVKPKFIANPKSVYVIPGGLGDLGLELTNWLAMRGAKTIVLSSRRGISTSYQRFHIRFWESLGCNIVISTSDITTYDGCKRLLQDAGNLGPVAGIFNLAGVLHDYILLNQTTSCFRKSLAPKAYATMYLDELSRTLCPKLEYFVVFSSAISSRGNTGQTNYAMANSCLDRIVENRVQQNFPGKSIQFGAIGDCGMLTRMNDGSDAHRTGYSDQRTDRSFDSFDDLLFSKCTIVALFLVSQEHAIEGCSLFERILQTFGVKDATKVRMSSLLTDLGADSLIVTEIKQILAREVNVNLSLNEVKALTVEDLKKYTGAN